MTRKKRRAVLPDHRVCNRCDRELPANPTVFLKDASRPLGLAYECRECHSARKKGRDRRTERWANLTAEGKAKRRLRMQKYAKSNKGRAVFLRKAYQRIDACDMTTAEVAEIILQPCTYCGTTDYNRGLDRIDNSLGHIKGNVLPACEVCNIVRGNRLTVDEMKRVGKVIAEIWQDRAAMGVESAARLGTLGRRPRRPIQ